MIYDDEGSLEAIEYLLQENRIERQVLDRATGILTISLYANENDLLVDKPEEPPYVLDLAGNWTIIELRSVPLITSSTKALQTAINMTLTMLSRNVMQAGFVERIIANALPPGKMEEDPNTGEIRFIPSPTGYISGPGATTMIQGLPIGDDPGNPEDYATPSVTFRDPADVSAFESTLNMFSNRLYYEMGQGHLLTTGDGGISGVSRIQLSTDFSNKLRQQSGILKASLGNLGVSALLMLAKWVGESKTLAVKNVDIVCTLNLLDHFITPEEHREIRDDFSSGVISHETTLERLNIEDIPAELDKVRGEKEQNMKEAVMQAEEFAAIPPATASVTTPATKKKAPTKPTTSVKKAQT
jgi:hypothetical protein